MNIRYKELTDILNSGDCFKMICGAGNEDASYVKKLEMFLVM